jgi:hypothetical protein
LTFFCLKDGILNIPKDIQQLIVTEKTETQYIANDDSIKKLKNSGISQAFIELIPLYENMEKILGLGFDKMYELKQKKEDVFLGVRNTSQKASRVNDQVKILISIYNTMPQFQ